jgi:hypothetical protein
MTLRTLADVRKLIRHLPAERRRLPTWQRVAADIEDAARGGDVTGASISLRLILMIERVTVRLERNVRTRG